MPISINPIFPVIAAQGVAGDVVLQPGTVIDAQVLKILANDLVRIAIANLSIEVLSEIPLQVGQTLQLAVSQTTNGIKLAAVGRAGAASVKAIPDPTDAAVVNVGSSDTVTLAPHDALTGAVARAVTDTAPLKTPPAPLEALAVSAAAQTAAARQGSLAPLFANLELVAVSDTLPEKLQQAVAPLLALRPNLDQNLTGSDVKGAFENSGLFLESSLASESVALSSTTGGVPDLKAALIVLRQTLLSLGGAAEPENVSTSAAAQRPQRPVQMAPGISAAGQEPRIAASLAPSLITE